MEGGKEKRMKNRWNRFTCKCSVARGVKRGKVRIWGRNDKNRFYKGEEATAKGVGHREIIQNLHTSLLCIG